MNKSLRNLQIAASGMLFDADCSGSDDAQLVLLLHGFPQTSHTYRHALPALAAAGYRAVAPNQRGYCEGARPEAIADYATELLVSDALAIADALGSERFHLVGHDWGGQLAWLLAAQWPERVQTLTVLSRPHPAAFAEAMRDDPAQAERSRHHRAFHDPSSAQRLLADGARRLRKTLSTQGVGPEDIDAYLARLGDEPTMNAALHWYRARANGSSALVGAEVPAVSVPTLYIWGDADATVGRCAAEATARYVSGPYRFELIRGAGHFLTDQAGERVTELLLSHLTR
jgi:pimeloyl-ACP methyl ester carboxylesterase